MVENYKNESMKDVAYSLLKEKNEPIAFVDLFKEVASKLELTPEESQQKIALFYTDITLDGRFVNLKDNTWDLRERQTYDKVHIDMNDVYSDIDEETAANADVEELDDEEKAELGVDSEDGDDSGDSNTDDNADGEADEEGSTNKEEM